MDPRRLAAVLLFAGVVCCGARSELRVPQPDAVASDALDVESPRDVPSVPDVVDARDVAPFDCRLGVDLCDDGNACTEDRCQADGTCAYTALRCDDQDPCTADRCDPARGCVFPLTECGGCADGQREAFRDRTRYADIAGCSGGFAIAGLATESSPACGRAAGDDGPNPAGVGCTASDLCAPGWHVCRSAGDVAAHSPDGCVGARDAPPGVFFASRQTGPGCLQCATGTSTTCTNLSCRDDCAPGPNVTNDIFGCGTLGAVPLATCAPLDRSSQNLCGSLTPPWRCDQGPAADAHESDVVVKPGPGAGGVLCCRD